MSCPFSEMFKDGRSICLEAGDHLFLSGDPVHFMYLITGGQVDLLRHTRTGSVMIMNRVFAGRVAAEASAYSDTYHCDARARSASTLRALPVDAFLKRLESNGRATRQWAEYLAHELQQSRLQAEIRALKTVAERLDAWVGVAGDLPPKGSWQDVAQILGVSREALYRELARRRRDLNVNTP